MSREMAFTSEIDPHQRVMLDPWAVNPMLDDAEQSAPATVALARATSGEPPTMFSTGDVPPFTASGVDARFLSSLPWRTRHAAAVNSDPTAVLGYVESYANDPDASLPSPGLADYISRFRDWLGGRWVNPNFTGGDSEQVAAGEDAVLNSLFGASNDRLKAKLDQVNAVGETFDQIRSGQSSVPGLGRAQR